MMREELLEHEHEGGDGTSEGSSNRGLSEFKVDLGQVGKISTSYHHQDHLLTAREPLILPGAFLKWYDLKRADEIISECLTSAAQAVVSEEIANGQIPVDYGVGFVVLHQMSSQAFLMVGSWHETQEFQETLYTRDLTAGTPFERAEEGCTAPLAVWDLAPLWHERQAWTRYLFSGRGNGTRQSYLGEFLSSAV